MDTFCTCYACDHEWEADIAHDDETGDAYLDVDACPECGETEDIQCGEVGPDPDREDFHADG